MRPGFMIYHSNMKALLNMSDKDLGVLLKLLYRVSLGEAVEPPPRLRVVFDMMAERVREDAAAYDRRVEKNRNNANARWNQTNAIASDGIRSHPIASNGMESNLIESNLIQSNRIESKRKRGALDYAQRNDDMSDVLMKI